MAIATNENSVTVGVSINSAALELVAINPAGNVLSSRSSALNHARSVVDQVHELIIEHDTPYQAIGLAVPGLVDTSGRIIDSRLATLKDLDLRGDLGELVDGHIVIENDANAAAFAEWKVGVGKAGKDIFRIAIGEGVGAGIVLNGRIWRGSHGFAGEIGSIVIDDEGNRLEDIASVPGIVRRTRNRFHQDNTSILKKLDEQQITLKDISNAAELEDDLALLMFERTGVALGTVVGGILNTLNVELVVLSGEPTRSNPVLVQAISDRVRGCTLPAVYEGSQILVSELGDDASAIGAALLANVENP
jgi:predicted NBD/HSP70 family sugar kinase